jgi:hypothetical protein
MGVGKARANWALTLARWILWGFQLHEAGSLSLDTGSLSQARSLRTLASLESSGRGSVVPVASRPRTHGFASLPQVT